MSGADAIDGDPAALAELLDAVCPDARTGDVTAIGLEVVVRGETFAVASDADTRDLLAGLLACVLRARQEIDGKAEDAAATKTVGAVLEGAR